jgi:hypothetical protein
MSTTYKEYYFSFTPEYEEINFSKLEKMYKVLDKPSVEMVENMFRITFASGVENDRPIYLYQDSPDSKNDILFNKFDGKVDLSVPPFDHLTSAPLYKKDAKFKIEWMYIRDELVRIKTFINSNLRSTIDY